MDADRELKRWRLEWEAESFVPADLRRRVERDVRSRRWSFWASVAVTIVIGGGTTFWATASGDPAGVQMLVAVWLFIGITWATSVQLDRMRGPSTPLAETTAAFLEVAIRSCHVRRQGIAVAAALYAGFFAFMLGWRYRQMPAEMPLDVWTYLTSDRVLTQCAITVVLALAALRRRRQLEAERLRFVAVRQELGGRNDGDPLANPAKS